MDHIPCDLITAGHPMVLIDRFVAVYLDEVETAVRREVLIHLSSRHNDGLGLRETACRGLHDGECFGQDLRQHALVLLFDLFLEFVYLVVDFLTFLNRRSFDGCFQLSNAVLTVLHRCLQLIHQRLRMRA